MSFDNPDPQDACRRQVEQILICKTWLAMEGLPIEDLHKHVKRTLICLHVL